MIRSPSTVAQRLAWPAAGLSVALTVTAFVLSRIEGGGFGDEIELVLVATAGVGALSAMGALIASRTGNLVGWVLLGIVTALTLSFLGSAYGEVAVPRGLPLGAFAATVVASVPLFVGLALFPAVFLVFPTGRLPSPRWRPVGIVYVLGLLVLIVGFSLEPLPAREGGVSVTNPLAVDRIGETLELILGATGLILLACAFASLAALVVRYRTAGTQERQQIRWLAFVGMVAGAALIGTIATGAIVESDPARWGDSWTDSWLSLVNAVLLLTTAAALAFGIPLACVVAILRYRLYDLDRVIRRTVVVGVLVAAITLVYVAGVAVAGSLVEGDVARFAAAALVAVAFQPLRERVRRLADRLVYGERATPYEVLASFTGRVGGSYAADDVLPRMVRVLGSAIGAERSTVWIRVGASLQLEAAWPGDAPPARRELEAGGLPRFAGEHAVEVRDQGELLGAIVVRMPPGDPMTPTRERLVKDLASQAGLLLRNVRLIEELRASRQRLVAAQDEERRKLERNIHDGVQQQLVALNVQLGLLARGAVADPEAAAAKATRLQEHATTALEDLRDLARGIYPPLLADRGLSAALEAPARRSPIPVAVDADPVGRYPPEIESAVYFCALEALNNVAKYSQARSARIRLGSADGELHFEVTDDGIGFDPGETGYGTGLQGMADRLDAIGGRLEVESSPGHGTRVRGSVPVSPP
jgi:signal transduction histidine kinase